MVVYLQTLTRFYTLNFKPRYVFAGLIVFLAIPLVSFSTEKDPKKGVKSTPQAKEDSVGMYESENKVQDPFVLEDQPTTYQVIEPSARDNTSYESTLAETEKTEVEEDPNSAMSFNFIYYIIDKFKLADPMD